MDLVQNVIDAASGLSLEPRKGRWAHVSLGALDSVFSIGARYATTTRTCRDYAAEGLRNRQCTSPRGGVPKAEAALEYAQILVAAGVHRYADVDRLLADDDRLTAVEEALRRRRLGGRSSSSSRPHRRSLR